MLNVDDMILFAEVVKAGGFSRAADRLGRPKSSISRRIAYLESQLGARLLERTTRKMRLTEVGQTFLQHCNHIVDEVMLATHFVEKMSDSPRGLLRISASYSVGRQLLGPVTTKFMEQFPEVKVQLTLCNRRIDLIEEGFDLAIRVGPLTESNLVAKKIGGSRLSFYASPLYLHKIKPPRLPADLEELCVLHMSKHEFPSALDLSGPEGTETVNITFRGLINDFHLLKQMIVDGAGIAILPSYLCLAELAAGQLVKVLPEWSLPEVDFHAIYPSHQGVTPKLRVFLDLLKTQLADLTGQELGDERNQQAQ